MTRWLLSAGLALVCVSATAGEFAVQVGAQQIAFTSRGGVPVRWVSCYPDCDAESAVRAEWFSPEDGFLRWSIQDEPALSQQLQEAEFTVQRSELPDAIELVFSAAVVSGGQPIELVYRLPKQGYQSEFLARGADGLVISIESGSAFIPEQLPGFGSIYSKVQPVTIQSSSFEYLEPPESGIAAIELPESSGLGLRNRYWLWLLSPQQPTAGEFGLMAENRPQVSVQLASESGFFVYTGPTDLASLTAADPQLRSVLFSAIWDWLRLLSFGLLFLLEALYSVVGNYGVAIILLSLSVKVLMFPLTYIADRWQAQVNATSTLLKPQLDAIKANYKGEEAHNRILAVYKEHNVSQFYTLRSLFGFLIQIPVFIAAFDMLAESFPLGEAGFLWIENLAKPDGFAALPFVLPFFGGELNLLPFAMTALTIVAAIVQEEAALSADLQRQQRIKLFLMSGAFFLLFYTFPAGMVLYWTSNNLFHLLKILPARLLRSPSDAK